MLFTNQRLNKLAAARVDFTQRGMLECSKLKGSLQILSLLLAFCSTRLSILTNATDRMRKGFNDEIEGTGKHTEDLTQIVNDPNILAYTELGKVVCT
jgi:hypothetical protein